MTDSDYNSEAEEHIDKCNKIIECLAKHGKDNARKLGACLAENENLKRENEELKISKSNTKRSTLNKFAAEWAKEFEKIEKSCDDEFKLSYEEALKARSNKS